MANRYKDLNLLTLWIENQKSFGKHKKRLDNIYNIIDKKSVDQLGLRNNNQIYSHILNNNIALTKQFIESEKNITIYKNNNLMLKKINSIHNRENKFHRIENEHNAKMDYIRNRTHKLKHKDNSNINKMNSFLGNRINNKSSCLSVKKMEADFNKTQYYKNFTKRYHLPEIKKAANTLTHLDTSLFIRKPNNKGTLITQEFSSSELKNDEIEAHNPPNLRQQAETNYTKFRKRVLLIK